MNESDVTFFRSGETALEARLYRPEGSGPFPAVVEVHGGAWTSGDRTSNAGLCRHLAENGIAVLALDFRMPPAARYPQTVGDVHLGIRWLKANAALAGTRSELVGALGTSSGGHLMLLAALRPHDERYAALALADAPDVDASLAFAVACWPVADPLARYLMAHERENARLVAAHDAFWPDVAAMEEGNPLLLLERGEAQAVPPLLVLQGTQDENLPEGLAEDLIAAYRRAGGTAGLLVFPGEPHSFIGRPASPQNAQRALDAIVRFVHERTAAAPRA